MVGDLYARHEALTGELAKGVVGMNGDDADERAAAAVRLARLADIELRAVNPLMEALDRFGATPQSRARWRREMAAGETLAESAKRLREGGKG